MYKTIEQSAFIIELSYKLRMNFNWKEIKTEKPKEKLNRIKVKA